MSDDESTMPQACWASLVLALLEHAAGGESPKVETEEPDERERVMSPKVASPEPPAESFLSETTAARESPGEPSFTDGSRIAFNASFHDETFMSPEAPRPRGTTSVAAAELARQHLEWAQELESVDQRQVDLMMTQWKLIRSQTGMLAQQVIEVRKELDQVKTEQQKSNQHWEQQTAQVREVQHRLGSMLQQSVEESHMAMARMRTEVQKRATQESELQRRLQGLEAWAGSAFPKLDRELAELRGAVEMSVRQCGQLKDQLLQQVEDWKSGHGMVMEHSTKMHERMRKGLRALMTAHETQRGEVQQAQQDMQEQFRQQLENKFLEVQGQLEQCNLEKDDSDLRARMDDLEALLDVSLDRHTKGTEPRFDELDQRCKELENSSKWMAATLSQEMNSRNAVVEVLEQMLKTETSKISSSVSDQIAVAQMDCKETHKTILDHLSKETSERQEQARAIYGDISSLGSGLGDRLGRLEGTCHSMRQDWRESQHSLRSLQGQLRLVEDGLESGLQGLRGELHSALREERLKREVTGTGMAEQVQAWEDFHKHLRQFYMAHTTLPADQGRLRDSEMNMARLAEMLRCSQDSELSARVEDVPDILRDSQVTSES